ncbi:hypothetical protein P0F07_003316, partial [Vibrio metschnikovii]|nr:hypothetical protein [Vibrio metschnikovii]
KTLKPWPILVDHYSSTSFEQVATDALRSQAIKGNPLPLTHERLVYILRQVCSCSKSETQNIIPPLVTEKRLQWIYNSRLVEGSEQGS